MKNIMKRSVLILMAAAAFAVAARADDPSLTLTLSPTSGTVTGGPGSTVGFGFTLTDSGPYYVVLDDSSFIGSPLYASYTDYIASQFYVAGPGSAVISPFDPSTLSGTGEFDLYSTDPLYSVFSGIINIQYDLFSENPNDPNFDPDSWVGSGTLSDNVSVEVTPEPATWVLMLLPFAAMMFFGFRRQQAGLRF
jgi:hypothetical protein